MVGKCSEAISISLLNRSRVFKRATWITFRCLYSYLRFSGVYFIAKRCFFFLYGSISGRIEWFPFTVHLSNRLFLLLLSSGVEQFEALHVSGFTPYNDVQLPRKENILFLMELTVLLPMRCSVVCKVFWVGRSSWDMKRCLWAVPNSAFSWERLTLSYRGGLHWVIAHAASENWTSKDFDLSEDMKFK